MRHVRTGDGGGRTSLAIAVPLGDLLDDGYIGNGKVAMIAHRCAGTGNKLRFLDFVYEMIRSVPADAARIEDIVLNQEERRQQARRRREQQRLQLLNAVEPANALPIGVEEDLQPENRRRPREISGEEETRRRPRILQEEMDDALDTNEGGR